MAQKRKQIKLISGWLAIILCTSTYSSTFGQESKSNASALFAKRNTVVVESEGKSAFVTNKFYNNWFIGTAAGAQMHFSDHNKQMNFGERLSPAFEAYVGKWFSPTVGTRVMFGGFKINGVTQNGTHSTGEVYDAAKRLQKQEINFFYTHADVLFNVTNMLTDYEADRFYNFSPYLGFGWLHKSKGPKQNEGGANIGLYNAFRLGPALEFTLDVRGTFMHDRFDGEVGNRRGEGLLSTTFGLAYIFKTHKWRRLKSSTIRHDKSQLVALAVPSSPSLNN
jgi:hypothetical protein